MHKKTICIAALFPGHKKATEWTIEHNETSIRRLVKKLQRESGGGEIRACYEAGPCGYALQRRLAKSSIVCEVIALSLVPVKPGERIRRTAVTRASRSSCCRPGCSLKCTRQPKRKNRSATFADAAKTQKRIFIERDTVS